MPKVGVILTLGSYERLCEVCRERHQKHTEFLRFLLDEYFRQRPGLRGRTS